MSEPAERASVRVLLKIDFPIAQRDVLDRYLEKAAAATLGHFGERITRVDAHLSHSKVQGNGPPGRTRCALEASMSGLEPAFVTDDGESAAEAIDAAMVRLKHLVTHRLGMHEHRRREMLNSKREFDDDLARSGDEPVV